jgi:hypothetical protein
MSDLPPSRPTGEGQLLDFELTHELLGVRNYHSRNVLYWHGPEGVFIETVWKFDGIQKRAQQLPARPFVMACRALCGLDLRRPHLSCLLCNIRRTYYGLQPQRRKVHVHMINYKPFHDVGRDFPETIRYFCFKAAISIAEFFANLGDGGERRYVRRRTANRNA